MNKFNIGDIVNIIAQGYESHRDLNPWVVNEIRLDNKRMCYHIKSVALGADYKTWQAEENLELDNGLETRPVKLLAACQCSLGSQYWHVETYQIPLRVIQGGHANIAQWAKDNMYTEPGRPVHMFVLND